MHSTYIAVYLDHIRTYMISKSIYVHILICKFTDGDTKVREDLVQKAAELCLNRMLRPKRGRAGAEASPPALPLTAAWMLRPNQGRDTLGKLLEEMRVSTTKKQVLQTIAGAFPCNAVLHKWGIAP
jgi:hypothetical protein